ncbi:nuclease [Citrus sinensis]|uniref:Uncharacterized protein n=1 Tax=Citrus clementina TaxID=85681 RepID=V4U9H8_CITCL|nr:hypothetical protein CICLE_v10017509mg [Citrus x clementina]KAH9744731.1 nuclease [Citrus sinensis]
MTANNNIYMVHYLNQLNDKVIHDGLVIGHKTINCDREMAYRSLFNDYFSENPHFNDSMFRRRFRISRSLFSRITNVVQDGMLVDATDEYIKIGESTIIESLKRFCRLWKLLQSNILDHRTLLTYCSSCSLCIKGNEYNMGYYLADEIICHETRSMSERCRTCIGVLQSHFAIVAGPSRFWNKYVLHDIMTVCIIMHSMIIKDERDVNATINDWMQALIPTIDMRVDENTRFQEFLTRHKQIKDKEAHIAL